MIKNRDRLDFAGQSPMTNNQTVVVLDEHGEVVGKTYPKRAKGLIKKGRAEALTENVIRLGDFRPKDSNLTEEIKMDVLNEKVINNSNEQAVEKAVENLWKTFTGKHEYILFSPRKWYTPEKCSDGPCERYMYQSPDGKMTEIYSLGDWNRNYSEIRSRFIPVSEDTDYTFVFWLNGGENDRYDETCSMIAVYTDAEGDDDDPISDDEWDQRYIYRLNRGGVKPIRNIDGWYLFAIDLPKPDKKLLELRFAAERAPMALKAAEEPSAYAELEDRPDEFNDLRPQRHNIVFKDGWPDDKWYSTEALRRKAQKEQTHTQGQDSKWSEMLERLKRIKDIQGHFSLNGDTIDFSDIAEFAEKAGKFAHENGFKASSRSEHDGARKSRGSMNIDLDDLAEQVADSIDLDEIAEQVADNLDIDEIAEQVVDNLDIDDIAEQVMNNIDLDDIADNIDLTQVAAVLDVDGLADEVADRIDLDDLAEKIAEKLDIKGLLREILED